MTRVASVGEQPADQRGGNIERRDVEWHNAAGRFLREIGRFAKSRRVFGGEVGDEFALPCG